jgi:hypothetical protein
MPDLGTNYKGIFRVPSSVREDGTVQTFKIGAGVAFQASSVQYSKLFAQRIGAASKRVLPAQTPGLWASGSGSGFGSGDRQLPSAPPSTLIHYLQYLLSIAPVLQLLSPAKSE